MAAAITELFAYLLIAPLRLAGLIGGERLRARTRRVEDWLLRRAWAIGASGFTYDHDTGGFSEDARRSVWVHKFKEQAELDLERSTPDLQHGPRRVEAADLSASRSEQLKAAMLAAQQEQQSRTRQRPPPPNAPPLTHARRGSPLSIEGKQ